MARFFKKRESLADFSISNNKYSIDTSHISLDEMLKREENEYTKVKILEYLSERSPDCPCNMAYKLRLKESHIYHYLSELLADDLIYLTTIDESSNDDSRKMMDHVRDIESKCQHIDLTFHEDTQSTMKKKELWFSYFQGLINDPLAISLYCILSQKGEEYLVSAV